MNRRRHRDAILVSSLLALTGCVNLDPLRERDFPNVTVEQLEAAAQVEDVAVRSGVVELLEHRLRNPLRVDLDVALEALICLRSRRQSDAYDTVVRCARSDPDEEIRYLSLDTAQGIDRRRAADLLAEVSWKDRSELVREHAIELGNLLPHPPRFYNATAQIGN